MLKHTLFISDLHLQLEKPDLTEKFTYFLNNEALNADALYILGDFFEIWIGDDDNTDFNNKIIQQLKNLSLQGVPIFFMAGNRDIIIGKKFAKKSGVTLLPDPTIINLYGQNILLSHGDMLCTLDIRHQKFRRCLLNTYIRKILLTLPLSVRRKIANNLRKNSGQHNYGSASAILDVTPEAVEKIMTDNQVKYFIHGHTHRPKIHSLIINNQQATRIVMGAWHDDADFIRFYENNDFELVKLSSQKQL